ncbi:hypothetical protein Y032_0190g1242 [Ancylostoma ceylanicum]|uniref:PLC-beta PH domain-containing protein n=1 Tax=Ancylostoma ceylanicum TaxID=53326 RepID=A0A016SQ62_9BILA|nr:hypothetical protein Y032_0190g1242 [Ancylostoma ceylanicum]
MTSGNGVPTFFTKGSKFLLLDNRKKSLRAVQTVTLRVDPHGHIVYWTPKVEGSLNYIFVQDIVDVRTGAHAAENHVSMKEIRNSVQLLMTVVDNVDFIHPNFTTFIYLEDNVKNLKLWADSIFQLSLSRRRRHFGILYHVRKRLAPFLYASGITKCSLEE